LGKLYEMERRAKTYVLESISLVLMVSGGGLME
jgi:hypothetical protein